MKKQAVVLSVAGSDSSCGAGIQADLKTISALGGYACCAIAALTAQNTVGVSATQGVAPEMLRAQMQAVFADIQIDAVKTGMLYDAPQVETVADVLERQNTGIVVVDPLMTSSSGRPLLTGRAADAMKKRLFPLATLLTPNLPEAELLASAKIATPDDAKRAAERIKSAYKCRAVVVKGGHRTDSATDILLDENNVFHTLTTPLVASQNTHGTGCTFASAMATLLAQGHDMPTAFRLAKDYIFRAIESGASLRIGHGNGPLNHFF